MVEISIVVVVTVFIGVCCHQFFEITDCCVVNGNKGGGSSLSFSATNNDDFNNNNNYAPQMTPGASKTATTTTTANMHQSSTIPLYCGDSFYNSSNNNNNNAVLSSRVVGGSNAVLNEFPFQVRIKVSGIAGGRTRFCGGSIIADRSVLTAAHCVYGNDWWSITVYFADHRINVVDKGEFTMETTEAFIHPQYFGGITREFDFAVLRLPEALQFDSLQVQPICLPQSCDEGDFCKIATITGWGATDEETNQIASRVLQKANLPFVNNSVCQKIYAPYWVPITPNMICAGSQGGSVDTCQGDSGGPLFCKRSDDAGRYHLVGVTSFGIGCARAGMVGVYGYVCKVLPWIMDVANGAIAITTANTAAITGAGGSYDISNFIFR